MSQFLISAAHKSSGKTTISIGLCAALKQRGLVVQPFKKGPDYIDPMWLSLASGRPCRNLDFYLMDKVEIQTMYRRCSSDADVSLVEGNKGLYDGLDLEGSNSNSALAHLLEVPVILVIDARGMTRGIAPLILGYQAFDRDINIAGVILNQLGGARHESKLRAVIEHYTDVPVLGAVHHNKNLQIDERHLGLMPSNETEEATRFITEIRQVINDQVDLDRLLQVGKPSEKFAFDAPEIFVDPGEKQRIRIGVARDKAFGFYYADDLDALASAGAELVSVDTLNDTVLPEVDGLFIGGGFPELMMENLEANAGLRQQIRTAIDSGMPVYAECGGLMYLSRSLTWHGKTCEMVGVIPGDVLMHEKPVGRGYVRLEESGLSPLHRSSDPEKVEIPAHEFHYSSLENLGDGVEFAYRMVRGHGVDGHHDGIVYKNLFASYCHLRSLKGYNWAERYVDWVRKLAVQRQQAGGASAQSVMPPKF